MKTREEMRAEIEAGIVALLQPLEGRPVDRAGIKEMLAEYVAGLAAIVPEPIKVVSCEVDDNGKATLRVSVPPGMVQAVLDAGWKLV